MTVPLVAAAGAILIGAGLLTIATAFRTPATTARPPRLRALRRRLNTATVMKRRPGRMAIAIAAVAGLLIWVTTGWAVAAVVLPAGAAVVPSLLRVPDAKRAIKRLEASAPRPEEPRQDPRPPDHDTRRTHSRTALVARRPR